jgi:hypothetical protein
MYRYAAGKLPLRAAQASRSLHTSTTVQCLAAGRRYGLVAGRKPLALMAAGSMQRRSYAMAVEDTNKGVVCCAKIVMGETTLTVALGSQRLVPPRKYRQLH